MRMLRLADLEAKGIGWSRQHIHEKVKRGEFPKPVHLSRQTVAWVESEIDAWLEERVAARDSA